MYPNTGGGAHVKISIFGFEIWPSPIFAGLVKSFSYFSGFHKISATILGSDKFPAIFLGLPIFVSHN